MNFSAKQGILSQVTLTKETIIFLHSKTADFLTDHFLFIIALDLWSFVKHSQLLYSEVAF